MLFFSSFLLHLLSIPRLLFSLPSPPSILLLFHLRSHLKQRITLDILMHLSLIHHPYLWSCILQLEFPQHLLISDRWNIDFPLFLCATYELGVKQHSLFAMDSSLIMGYCLTPLPFDLSVKHQWSWVVFYCLCLGGVGILMIYGCNRNLPWNY